MKSQMQSRKSVFCSFFLGFLFFIAAASEFWIPQVQAEEDPPNIIFILVDDLGWTDISCHEVEEDEDLDSKKSDEESVDLTSIGIIGLR